jgi:acyl carrier protein
MSEQGIPRGVEVLVKKAAVDPEFRTLLLTARAEAAREIGLVLDPAEQAMLRAVGQSQLEAIIARTTVPQEHRRTFLGKAAAAMLAAIGAMDPQLVSAGFGTGKKGSIGSFGHMADQPPATKGFLVDEKPVQDEVIAVVAKQLGLAEKDVSTNTLLVRDPQADAKQPDDIRFALEKRLQIGIPAEVFQGVRTVGDAVANIKTVQWVERQVREVVARHLRIGVDTVSRKTFLVDDLKMNSLQRRQVRSKLVQSFDVSIPFEGFDNAKTLGDVADLVVKAVYAKAQADPVVRGIRPDRIPITKGTRPGP